jgi:hypothetical protein
MLKKRLKIVKNGAYIFCLCETTGKNRRILILRHSVYYVGGITLMSFKLVSRVSSETSFVSKQPKLEPKLVSALSETRRLFRLFRFNIETGSFGVSKQPKQTKDQPKQQQICSNINLFNSPYHKLCLFWLFDIGPKYRNKPQIFWGVSQKTN